MILSATDNADGTGAVLSLSGGNVGDASVYVSRFAGTNDSRAFTLAGTITDDSTLSADLETGPYLAFAVNGAAASDPITFRVTDGTDALHWRCMQAVREYILSLALPSVSTDPDNHLLCKLPYRPDLNLDIENNVDCAVMYFPKAETVRDADNERNTIDYGVQVLLIRKIGKKLTQGLEAMLMQRELLTESMTLCPLPDLDDIHTVNVVPGQVIMPDQWAKSYDCSTVVFRCLTEQTAGIF